MQTVLHKGHSTPDKLEWPIKKLRLNCGAQMAYVELGEGEPIVLVHGYPQSHLCWRHQIKALALKFRVIALDLLGWGESDRRLDIIPEYHQEVARLAEALNLLKLSTFNLFTHDYGGLLGLGYVEKNPNRVNRFAIINSRAHKTFSDALYKKVWLTCTMARWPLLRWLLKQSPIGSMHFQALEPELKKGCFDNTLLDKYIGWMDTKAGREWYAHFYRYFDYLPRKDLEDNLSRITCPVSIIWGEQDPFFPLSTAQDLRKHIPHSTLVIIKGAGHYVMEERPHEVLEALQALMQVPIN